MSQFESQNDEPQPDAATPEAHAPQADRMAPADPAAGSTSGNGNGAGASDDYGADKIKVLEGLEAVRKRPAMYIGSTGAPGLQPPAHEIVEKSTHEAPPGFSS